MPREFVNNFAEAMERKLQKHDDEKGDTGWLDNNCPVKFLLSQLKEELEELEDSIAEVMPEHARQECVDVANFAMMIWSRIWTNNRIIKREDM
ncbi:MAG: hypothetical protein GY820_16960 [Gammaproteobacteria bacterium]|nr:hypothetical protein [Gammaproteobacteria bacterium]